MKTAIENLNNVQEQREFLVSQILWRISNGKTYYQCEQLEKKLSQKSFKSLDRQLTKLTGDWRELYGKQ